MTRPGPLRRPTTASPFPSSPSRICSGCSAPSSCQPGAANKLARDGGPCFRRALAAWLGHDPGRPGRARPAPIPPAWPVLALAAPNVGLGGHDRRWRGQPLGAVAALGAGAVSWTGWAVGLRSAPGLEAEFFLLQPAVRPIADGREASAKPCYRPNALMRQFELIGGLLERRRESGLGAVPGRFHEDANGQFEINWTFADALGHRRTGTPSSGVMAQAMASPLGLAGAASRPSLLPLSLFTAAAPTCTSLWDNRRRTLSRPPRLSSASRHWRYHSWPACWSMRRPACAITNVPTAERAMRRSGASPPQVRPPGRRLGSLPANNRSHHGAHPMTSAGNCAWPVAPPQPLPAGRRRAGRRASTAWAALDPGPSKRLPNLTPTAGLRRGTISRPCLANPEEAPGRLAGKDTACARPLATLLPGIRKPEAPAPAAKAGSNERLGRSGKKGMARRRARSKLL